MRRPWVVAGALFALAGASPARAHQEISPASVAVGRPAFLTLNAANEKRVDLTTVTLTPPGGQQFGHATREPAGWAAVLSHTRITWTGGSVRPDRFEQFGFDVEPIGQPGPLAFHVVLGYADGTTSESEVVVTAVVGGDLPAPSDPTAPPGEPVAAPIPVADDPDPSRGLATLALVAALAALAASVVAMARGRRPAPAGVAAGPDEEQDW